VTVSVLDDTSLDALKEAIWRLTGLIRVFLRTGGHTDAEPLALPEGSTAVGVATAVHKELGAGFRGARVWGPSARFEGQQVGRDHLVLDGDTVEILA
jgi:ribosome-interacting GTPase 1